MDHSPRLVAVALTLSAAVILGCGSSTSAPTATGSMTVTVTSADGSTPYVVVSGPNSYSKVISTTQKLTGLAAGNYTIVADTVVVADSVVGTNVDSGHVTGSPAAVAVGADVPVTVVYATKARTGGMWVTNDNYGTLPVLASSQLRTGGVLVAAETLATPMTAPGGLAMDAAGNMWESDASGDSLLMYSIAARNAGGGAPPTTVISSPQLTNANGIGFDANGNLWVTNCSYAPPGVSALYEFSVAQLADGGHNVTPAATINGSTYAICPANIAFDANGNAWVADAGAGHVLKYSASQLAAGSGSPAPVDTLGGAPAPGVSAVAVDASGNLWVGDHYQVAEFTAAQLTGGGSPAPNVIITLPNAFIYGLAFDNSGSLWVADFINGAMYGLTKSQLVTGSPTPSVSISFQLAGGVSPQQPLFDKYSTATAPSVARLRSRPITTAGAVHRLNRNPAHGRGE